ncbi:hypothetical protein HanPSC8_Chr00c002g0798741 [Helianthus annuus]|nr:hypothetical protein HanPSC8_Chr00c002g0798741 [Helianthus annuus]
MNSVLNIYFFCLLLILSWFVHFTFGLSSFAFFFVFKVKLSWYKFEFVYVLRHVVIFVYDLSKKRIGWTDYDCSNDVNVSITSSKDELSDSGSSRTTSVLQALLPHIVAVALGSSLW